MDLVVVAVFGVVYAGMLLGRLPGLALDRAGLALLGAIALVASGRSSAAQAVGSIDVPAMALLFGIMVVSGQLRLGGFYTHVTRQIERAEVSPSALVGLVVLAAGVLSALLVNDIVCFAMAPIVVEIAGRRKTNPAPLLLALACASNVGSAATLIGNPQNMLIGQVLKLGFASYTKVALVPTALGLAVVWAVVCVVYRGRFHEDAPPVEAVEAPRLDRWRSAKGLIVLAALVALFLFTDVRRDVAPLAGAGALLVSRRLETRRLLDLVDWPLLVLFISLFVVNDALGRSGAAEAAVVAARARGVDLVSTAWLFPVTVALSNLVSNVPAVMVLLPTAKAAPGAGPVLAIASTFAGNLFMAGSIANLIVAERAAQHGVTISWAKHARVGVPVTVLTLAIAWAWLAIVR